MNTSFDSLPQRAANCGHGHDGKWTMASRLGTSLKSARERLGWSRETLAHNSGLSWAAISQIESGRRREVRASTLVALASALGVSVDYLVGGAATVSPGLLNHRLVTYGSDDEYVASSIPFIQEGISRGDSVLAVVPPRHTGLLHEALGSDVRRIEFRDAVAWYRSLGRAASGYCTYVEEQFARGAPWIRIIGEPVLTGQSEGELVEWFRYEALINVAFASSPATVVCTYDTRTLPASAIEDARRTHPQISATGEVTASSAYRGPGDFLLGS
jgi:transcriptional regulator with XRE-family HTH domain